VPGNEVDLDKEMKLTEKERKQIEFQRALGHGKYMVYIEFGQPVRLEDIKKSIKL